MSSASIQIAAQGMQDVFLSGKPDVSYFSGVYRRHSPFLFNAAEYPFNTPINFGGSGFVKLPYKGDLLLGTTLKIVLPPLYTPGPGWVYPLQAVSPLSNINPYLNQNNYLSPSVQTQIRTNIPTFKVYFSDGANTICYIQRTVQYYNTYSPISDPISAVFTNGVLSSARLVFVAFSNAGAMTVGQKVLLPNLPPAIISTPYKLQTLDSGGTVFTYSTIDVTFSAPTLFTPLYAPVIANIYDQFSNVLVASGSVLSATSVPWVRNDFISVTYDEPTNAWRWKSIYSLIKPFSNVYLNILSNTAPLSVGSNIVGLPFFQGNVSIAQSVTSSIVTPVKLSTSEYISLGAPRVPIQIKFNNSELCSANATSIQYLSQFDFSNINMTFTDFKFKNILTLGVGQNTIKIGDIKIAPGGNILTSVDTVDPLFASNVSGTLYSGLVPVFFSSFSNIVMGSPTTLEFVNTIILKDLTITGLPYQATLKTVSNSYVSNAAFVTFPSQQIIPVTSNTNVTFSTGGSGVVSYSFFPSPVTIKKLAFSTSQSAVFWGFDPAALTYTGARF